MGGGFGNSNPLPYLYYITKEKRIMGTHISILEAVILSGLVLLIYVLIKTIYETPKNK